MQSRPSHIVSSSGRGYRTVRNIEDTEKEGEKTEQDCVIAACGDLPQRIQLLCRAMGQ